MCSLCLSFVLNKVTTCCNGDSPHISFYTRPLTSHISLRPTDSVLILKWVAWLLQNFRSRFERIDILHLEPLNESSSIKYLCLRMSRLLLTQKGAKWKWQRTMQKLLREKEMLCDEFNEILHRWGPRWWLAKYLSWSAGHLGCLANHCRLFVVLCLSIAPWLFYLYICYNNLINK